MRKLTLVLALVLSGCWGTMVNQYHTANTPGYDGRYDGKWYTGYGVAHDVLTVPVVLGSHWIWEKPEMGAAFMCGGYLFREIEETRGWKRFEWGVWDSRLDIIGPCVTGWVLTKILK